MKTVDQNTSIGFIGSGIMGRSMAGHLLAAGYPLHVHTRTRSKADPLLERGAVWHDTAGALAAQCEVIFTIVGFPSDVEAVYFGDAGLLARISSGAILVDMTTSSPELAVRIAEAAEAKRGHALDAPVSGGDKGAREAVLSIMVGGAREAFERVRPLLECMGRNIVHQGPPGSGQHCKLCNQITIAANMIGVCEAMAYACRAGLDPERVLQSISTGAASSWSLSNLAPRMLTGDFAPGFMVQHFMKDMTLAAKSAKQLQLDTPGLALALKMYTRLAEQGGTSDGTQALYKLYKGETT